MCWVERINRHYGCGAAAIDHNATKRSSPCTAYTRWQQEAVAWGMAETERLLTFVNSNGYSNVKQNPCRGAVNYRANYSTTRPCHPGCQHAGQPHYPTYIPLNLRI